MTRLLDKRLVDKLDLTYDEYCFFDEFDRQIGEAFRRFPTLDESARVKALVKKWHESLRIV